MINKPEYSFEFYKYVKRTPPGKLCSFTTSDLKYACFWIDIDMRPAYFRIEKESWEFNQ